MNDVNICITTITLAFLVFGEISPNPTVLWVIDEKYNISKNVSFNEIFLDAVL